MKILLCGADGFLGRHLERVLSRAGHMVRRGVRRPSRPGDLAIDNRRDLDSGDWTGRVAGCDAAINAVGILREDRDGDFDAIHHRAPQALFHACALAGVARVIQISALGADSGASAYFRSKAAADSFLLVHHPGGLVLRPSLVFGADGTSSRLFLALASLPVVGLPAGGRQPLRPLHVDDLCALVLRLLEEPLPARRLIPVAGPVELGFGALLACYREQLGFPPAVTVPIPAWIMDLAAPWAGRIPGSLLTAESWAMLARGNTVREPAAVAQTRRPPGSFLSATETEPARDRALSSWRGPWLRAALAAVWLVTATVCAARPDTGLDLLARFGLSGTPAQMALWAGILLDLALGVATLAAPGRRLWLAQAAVVAGYSLLVAWRLPEFLVHPYGPILKNLPILASLGLLWSEESRP